MFRRKKTEKPEALPEEKQQEDLQPHDAQPEEDQNLPADERLRQTRLKLRQTRPRLKLRRQRPTRLSTRQTRLTLKLKLKRWGLWDLTATARRPVSEAV